ncbi:hypothetical protein SDC9_168580 [bioreactor metagenome]|uniref:Uncharacterized protein n=1 Tax=bioreactor metagenome TaxID=1076179 RepID=A0A645G2Y0_9ZZZZ
MLIRGYVAADGRDMYAAFVGESCLPHIGQIFIWSQVGDLSYIMREVKKFGQVRGGGAINAQFEMQIWQNGAQVGIAAALTVAVNGALYLAHPCGDGRQ